MRTTGIIRADGSIQYHGYTPMNSRLLSISDQLIVIHHGGGSYSDNGGRHYVNARVEVRTIKRLKAGNTEGSWEFELTPGRGASWHATPKEAVREAMSLLRDRGDRIAREIEERQK